MYSIIITIITNVNQAPGSRTWRFNTAVTTARYWTRSRASSIHLPSSQLISPRSIL